VSADDAPSLLTPAEVARFLMGLSRRLDELVAEYQTLGYTAALARRDAEVAEARAYLGSGGEEGRVTVDERKRRAVLASSEQRFAADVAERRVHACREAIRAVQFRIDVGRTLSATTRAEMRDLGGQG